MAPAVQKLTLSPSRDIPFNKLVLSQSNVRRVKSGVSVEELAEDIARRGTLLQSLNVRPVLDADGSETGMFEVPAGGRRYQALALLVKQKRLTKTSPVPCVVRDPATSILAADDSLAENTQRVALHPLDQFRAFLDMRTKGMTEEEIAAAFFTTVQIVKQRLRLAAVSPVLCDIYAEDGMTLEMLMAFTVNPDPVRQEQVWESIQHSYNRQPWHIRQLLTETSIPASDKRAQFATLDDASRLALLAHCVSYGVNALYERLNPYSGSGVSQSGLDRRMAEADRLARATGLDMVEVGFRPTVENYLGRVTKPRILAAVREGAGERAAQLIDHLKKGDMAKEAERLLADSGWLPEPLRLVEQDEPATNGEGDEALPAFLADDDEPSDDEDEVLHVVAAE